uniref:Solute carrier family 66 member 1 n=1 Tax=Takifugu rubripes TaxID=31033 RepID=A0A674NJM3_TAKRU
MNRALSIWFLLLWLGGDSCNLIGSFLADQLPLQTYTAIYYVLADLGMLSLYFYYKIKNKMAENRTVLLAVGMICVIGSSTSWVVLPGFSNHQQINPSVLRSRTLLSTTDYAAVKSFPPKEIVGFSIGSVSSVLYLCSRLPQIFTNVKEVDRGSFLLPVCAGHPGKHPVRPEHSPEEPRLGSGREKLPGASPTLAHRQPRHPDVRPYFPHTCHILDRPALAH